MTTYVCLTSLKPGFALLFVQSLVDDPITDSSVTLSYVQIKMIATTQYHTFVDILTSTPQSNVSHVAPTNETVELCGDSAREKATIAGDVLESRLYISLCGTSNDDVLNGL